MGIHNVFFSLLLYGRKSFLVNHECHRILKPGGRLIVTTPSRAGIVVHEMLRMLRLVQDVEAEEHKDFRMTAGRLSVWVRESGFRVEVVRTFEAGLNVLLVAVR